MINITDPDNKILSYSKNKNIFNILYSEYNHYINQENLICLRDEYDLSLKYLLWVEDDKIVLDNNDIHNEFTEQGHRIELCFERNKYLNDLPFNYKIVIIPISNNFLTKHYNDQSDFECLLSLMYSKCLHKLNNTHEFNYVCEKINLKISNNEYFLDYLIKSLDIIIFKFLPKSLRFNSSIIIDVFKNYYYQLINFEYNRNFYNVLFIEFVNMNIEDIYLFFKETMKLDRLFLFDINNLDDIDSEIDIYYYEDLKILTAMFNGDNIKALYFYLNKLDIELIHKIYSLTLDKNLYLLLGNKYQVSYTKNFIY